MKVFPTKEGPYPVRLHYEVAEIDQICADALRDAQLMPSEPAPIKIDLFLERFFKVVIDYDDLGEETMGMTVFNSGGAVTGFMINSRLEVDGTLAGERRSRSTLAHEGGHGLLHAQLFMRDQLTNDLFEEGKPVKTPSKILCRKTDIGAVTAKAPRYDGRWWEWQANRAIGGLLLPKRLLSVLAAKVLREGRFGPELPETNRLRLEKEVADTFDVNGVVARIRISEMYPLPQGQKYF